MRAKTLQLSGWGRRPVAQADAYRPEKLSEAKAVLTTTETSLLARGNGRSYGDQALNSGGVVMLTERLDRLMSFDAETGELAAEAGISLRDIQRLFVPRGWILPVSPGTGFATLGGAIANDVHGKNHDHVGSFGSHVTWIELLLASGEVKRITAESDPALFAATLGGCGLTGVILSAGVRLAKAPSNAYRVTERRIGDLTSFMAALEEARHNSAYSVGWIDGMARGAHLGRGVLETADFAPTSLPEQQKHAKRVPFDFPGFALNGLSVSLFNKFYDRRVPVTGRERTTYYSNFLYPLDALRDWNKIYGKKGFVQFQCVIPDVTAAEGLKWLLEEISAARAASFLAVLKTLGGDGRGMLSFPTRGYTLALDFPWKDASTTDLMRRLERITLNHGGRIYLAKDSALSAEGFAEMYPRLGEFRSVLEEVDPQGRFASDQSRRLKIRSAS
ncbi:FAD-binding protein [Lacibacterium aquatile]|uniref:FAD-binding protein n=1 Tax=Lacibacterium aquatile TaxID=1168082 RepID=A0ABW5DLT4_9PROT